MYQFTASWLRDKKIYSWNYAGGYSSKITFKKPKHQKQKPNFIVNDLLHYGLLRTETQRNPVAVGNKN